VNTKSSLAEEFKNKAYRDAFVASQLRIGLPLQCRALRENRGWTQPQLAEAAGMRQPRISEMEKPGERKPNLDTLLRLASAFDVALQVRFVPFSQLVDEDDAFDYDTYYVKPFAEDMAQLEKRQQQAKSVYTLRPKPGPSRIQYEFRGSEQERGSVIARQGATSTGNDPNSEQAIASSLKRSGFENFSRIAS
jgi:transcriptional regulator with XRE-family HTH domain